MPKTDEWYSIKNDAQIDSPALLLYPQRVMDNISLLKSMVKNEVQRLRPHIKTHKTIEGTQLMIKAGIDQFKCATIAEAELLGRCGARDVLLAYQPVGPKLLRLVSLIQHFPATRYSCLTDHPDAAREMALVFSSNELVVSVYLDLNTGQNRTGIVPGEKAIQLYSTCANTKGIRPIGLHVYDGHIRDNSYETREIRCNEAFKAVEQMRDEIKKRGFEDPIIIAGGSPTFSIHCKRKTVQCSPGTFIFWDKGYSDLCREQEFLTAALVLTRVISLPDPNKICLDLGHKSISAENEISKRVFFLNAPELKALSQSEEHLVMDAGPDHGYRIGDLLYGLPFHICPTVALYERGYTVENQEAQGEWRILARDKKLTI
jgi:D-serine deaminase-like pyridoxal phosphate-dependent protein